MKRILTITLCFFLIQLKCQIVEGYDLATYPAKPAQIKIKAKLNLGKLILSKAHKAKLINAYETQPISFAGFYSTIILPADFNSSTGYMIDHRTGIVYTLPLNISTVGNSCFLAPDVFDRYLFSAESRLLVTSICKETLVENNRKIKQNQAFFFYLWNEGLKRFDLLKKQNKERIVGRE
jgi:hypothetical protein